MLERSKLEAVFLTNDFDDPLTGFDTDGLRPLPADRRPGVSSGASRRCAQRLEKATRHCGRQTRRSLRAAIGKLFEHFAAHGARACAISLPPDFAPTQVDAAAAAAALDDGAARRDGACGRTRQRDVGHFVFWTLAEFCAEFKLPFDLMIGVNRGVYAAGVYQGRDLYDSRVSLIQYRELFNAFPQVTFPISVLASVTNQELVSYSWIFPNVRDQRPLVVLEHADVHRARRGGPAGGGAADQADRLLQRHVQAGIRPAEVRHVQADPGQDPGRAVRHRPRLERRAGRRAGPAGAARQCRRGVWPAGESLAQLFCGKPGRFFLIGARRSAYDGVKAHQALASRHWRILSNVSSRIALTHWIAVCGCIVATAGVAQAPDRHASG